MVHRIEWRDRFAFGAGRPPLTRLPRSRSATLELLREEKFVVDSRGTYFDVVANPQLPAGIWEVGWRPGTGGV